MRYSEITESKPNKTVGRFLAKVKRPPEVTAAIHKRHEESDFGQDLDRWMRGEMSEEDFKAKHDPARRQETSESVGDAPGIAPEIAQQILSSPRCKHGVKLPATARLWRGESEDSGHGMAVYGLGLYFTADKKGAAMYGDVKEISRSMLPDNALRFDTKGDFQIWLQQAQKLMGFKSNLDFAVAYHDFADFIRALDPSIEGIQMFTGTDAMFVLYP